MGSRPAPASWLLPSVDMSQISACESSPAVQMCALLCGAQDRELTGAWCLCSSAMGRVGYLMGGEGNKNPGLEQEQSIMVF